MLSVKGIYSNGEIKLREKVSISKQTLVIVTFLEENEKDEPEKLNLNGFSFNRSREILKDFKGSLGDTVIEERRSFV